MHRVITLVQVAFELNHHSSQIPLVLDSFVSSGPE